MNWGRDAVQPQQPPNVVVGPFSSPLSRWHPTTQLSTIVVAAHVPVMLERVVELLDPALQRSDAVVIDATIGLGGHAEALLARHGHLTLIGLDRDPLALRRCDQRLRLYAERVRLKHAVYQEIPQVAKELGFPQVDGVVFDLGVSSMQLDEPERGFSYASDSPLDMRMDQTTRRTAEEILNTYTIRDLTRIFRDYGEEKFANHIARAIVREREHRPFASSAQLVELIRGVVPHHLRRTGHPAKRIFQALRIEVNSELDVLRRALPAAIDVLRPGGRLVVLSYHSLEDRITKQALAELARDKTPAGLPVTLPEAGPTLRLLTRGAEVPSPAEIARNPRSASAKLRAAQRIREVGR